MNKISLVNTHHLSKLEDNNDFYMKEYDERLAELLETLQNVTGKRVHIHSNAQGEQGNALLGQELEYLNRDGRAADIQVPGYKMEDVFHLAKKIGFDGIGLYRDFVHVDVRGTKINWIDKSYEI